jgi:TrmH family RNA methyltransferase
MRSAAARRREGVLVLEGLRVLQEYQARGERLEVYASSEVAPRLEDLGDALRVVPPRSLVHLSALVRPEGAIGIARRPVVGLEELSACEVVLAPAGLQDPGNLGTLVRSLVAFSSRAGLLVDATSVDVFGPKCVRAASGALASVAVAEVSELAVALESLGRRGFRRAALVPRGGTSPPWGVPGRLVLVVGAEGQGIAPELAGRCDELLTIPMRAGVDSVNAGVAGSIALAWLYAARASQGR